MVLRASGTPHLFFTPIKPCLKSYSLYIGLLSFYTVRIHRGGGALKYQMATHCQTAAPSRSSEHRNIGAVNSFEGKKGGVVNFKLSTL